MVTSKRQFVYPREDLRLQEIAVPIGSNFYNDKEKLEYRWVDESIFEVLFNNEWLEAYSIDWDFVSD